jgi:hypothetical protein
MKVLKTMPMTDATLTSAMIAEDDAPVWDSTTNWTLGAQVISLATHKVYQSLVHPNVNNNPTLEVQNDPDNPPEFWVELGATKRWRPFDGLRNNVATSASPMNYTITTNQFCDGLAILNADAYTVDVVVNFNTIEVYNKTFLMVDRIVSNWYELFFKPFQQKRNIMISDIPPIIGSVISITFNRDDGDVSVGVISVGSNLFIGKAQFGAESDLRSFSRNEPNEYGTTNIVRRTPKLITRQSVESPNSMSSFLHGLREDLESVVCVWSTLDDVENPLFNTYILNGIADRFVINDNNPRITTLQLELREI